MNDEGASIRRSPRLGYDKARGAPTLNNSPQQKTRDGGRRGAQTEFACQYIREQADRSYRKRLSRSQVLGGGLAPLAVGDRLVGDFLTFVEVAHAGAFDRADVNEHIPAAVVRLNEAEALLAVKPFHGSR